MGNSAISTTEARQVGSVVGWSQVDREGCLFAMERSSVRDVEIKAQSKPALTDAVNDRDAFMKGVDASCAYKGYASCSAAELGRLPRARRWERCFQVVTGAMAAAAAVGPLSNSTEGGLRLRCQS